MKIVAAIRSGRIVPKKPQPTSAQLYNIWSDADLERADHPMHMPAPKLKLPTHAESYNPPAEYLFTEDEKKEWEEADPSDRKTDYIPQKFDSLRKVPGFGNFVQQRFERCLDLYLAPRMRKKKPKFDPDELEPKLPSPSELRPFPTTCAVTYPHPGGVRVRCISVDPEGRWVVTGADDGIVRLWECRVGRMQSSWAIGRLAKGETTPIQGVEWCPVKGRNFFVVVTCVWFSRSNSLLTGLPLCTVRTKSRSSHHSIYSAQNKPIQPVPILTAHSPHHRLLKRNPHANGLNLLLRNKKSASCSHWI